MDILILVIAMIIVGVIIGAISGAIWKQDRPVGVPGDTIVAVISAVAIGLIDWYVIPAMDFSETIKYVGVAVEPALGSLLILWVIKLAKKR